MRRPDQQEVAAGLAQIGLVTETLDKASVDARGSTPCFATTTDGTRLFVKALGRDERSADLLFRTYRAIMPHDFGDERSFSSLRRTVEHEAMVAMAARELGVLTPPFVALATVDPDAFVLVYQLIDGSSLDGVDPDRLDDAVIGQIWAQVALLRSRRIAHRDLRLANIFLGADDRISIIDFGFSELAASDLLLATDLAELLASLTLAVGIDRSVARGRGRRRRRCPGRRRDPAEALRPQRRHPHRVQAAARAARRPPLPRDRRLLTPETGRARVSSSIELTTVEPTVWGPR